jgi:hypothetical protein
MGLNALHNRTEFRAEPSTRCAQRWYSSHHARIWFFLRISPVPWVSQLCLRRKVFWHWLQPFRGGDSRNRGNTPQGPNNVPEDWLNHTAENLPYSLFTTTGYRSILTTLIRNYTFSPITQGHCPHCRSPGHRTLRKTIKSHSEQFVGSTEAVLTAHAPHADGAHPKQSGMACWLTSLLPTFTLPTPQFALSTCSDLTQKLLLKEEHSHIARSSFLPAGHSKMAGDLKCSCHYTHNSYAGSGKGVRVMKMTK